MDPRDVPVRGPFLAEAESLLARGNFEGARQLAEERLDRLPSDLEGAVVLCRAILGAEGPDAADSWICEIESRIRFAAGIHNALGDSLARQGRLDEAARCYRLYHRLNPETREQEETAARTYPADGADREGEPGPEGCYEDVEEVDRRFWTVTLADLYIRQGHPEMARGVLEEILRREPRHQEARSRLLSLPGGAAGTGAARRERLAGELSRWLKNIDRLKIHGS
jgi:tetratricopeptide (TPR) repeat protein